MSARNLELLATWQRAKKEHDEYVDRFVKWTGTPGDTRPEGWTHKVIQEVARLRDVELAAYGAWMRDLTEQLGSA